jgi:flagellar hook-length control protein FliK
VKPDGRAVLPSHEQRTTRTGPERRDATLARLRGSSLDTSGDAGAAPGSAGIETGPATAAAGAAQGPEFGSTSPATSSTATAAATVPQLDPATLALLAGATPPVAAANPMASSTAATAITESARTASTTTPASAQGVAVTLREGRAEGKAALGPRTSISGRAESSPVDTGAHESPIEPALALVARLPGHDRALPAAAPAMDHVAVSADSARTTLETAASRPADEPALAAAQTAAALPVVTPPALLGGSEPMRAPTLPLEVALPVPVGSAHFREALNVQVSVLARDGVHHAELHLNPADMGPLSVQITLDGQQAQVHFGSDSALTRQIVETGLPSLAAALRDAGLTLSGGGVSQHASGQRQAARQSPSRSEDGPPASEPDARIVRTLRLPVGRLDTYA